MNEIQLLEKNSKGWNLKANGADDAMAFFTMLVTAETKKGIKITVNGNDFLIYEYEKLKKKEDILDIGQLVLFRHIGIEYVLIVTNMSSSLLTTDNCAEIVYRYIGISAVPNNKPWDLKKMIKIKKPKFNILSCDFISDEYTCLQKTNEPKHSIEVHFSHVPKIQ